MEICKVLQAVAFVDMDFFPDLEDIISKYQEEANSISFNFQEINERIATRAKIEKFIEKIYPAYQNHPVLISDYDGLYVACEALLEKKDSLALIGEDTKLKVCLLTWIIAEPDAENADFTITEFQKTKWELKCGNETIPHRAKVIKLLHICGVLSQWQALACEASGIDVTKRANSPYLSITDLIKTFNIPEPQQGAFRKKIERCRNDKTYGGKFFREIANPRVNEPKYEYKINKVALIVEEMQEKNVQRVSNEKKNKKINHLFRQ